MVFKIIPTLNNRLDETVKRHCALPSRKVFYESTLRLDKNGAIAMVTIFDNSKIVTNID